MGHLRSRVLSAQDKEGMGQWLCSCALFSFEVASAKTRVDGALWAVGELVWA